jgi:hypothetical protein
MLRLCAIPTALLLFTGVARGQVPATPDTAFGLPGNEPLDLSTPPPDESKHKTVNPVASMPPASDWSSKAGIDYRKPSFPAADLQPGALTAGSVPDQSNGVAWATVTAPGFQFPLGWDQTSIETRVDPSQQQSKVGTTLSRSVPVGENITATLQNGLAVTSPLPNATTHNHGWTSNQSLRFNVLPTDTSMSLGANIKRAGQVAGPVRPAVPARATWCCTTSTPAHSRSTTLRATTLSGPPAWVRSVWIGSSAASRTTSTGTTTTSSSTTAAAATALGKHGSNWPHTQGREASGSACHTGEQVRIHHQPANGQGARH